MEEFKSKHLAVITSSQGKGMAEILPRKIHQTFKMFSGWLGQAYPSRMLVPHLGRRTWLGQSLTGCLVICPIFPANLVAGAVRLLCQQGRMDQEAMHSLGTA